MGMPNPCRGLRAALLSGLACSGAACSSAWNRYEDSLYTALKVPGPESFDRHERLLSAVVQEADAAERKPPPGIMAEYGLYLARRGRTEEARKYFDAEAQAYPESAVFVAALRRTIEGRRAFQPAEAESKPASHTKRE